MNLSFYRHPLSLFTENKKYLFSMAFKLLFCVHPSKFWKRLLHEKSKYIMNIKLHILSGPVTLSHSSFVFVCASTGSKNVAGVKPVCPDWFETNHQP